MTTRKETYMHFAERNIFLPEKELDKVMEQLKDVKLAFATLYALDKNQELKKFRDPKKGAYSLIKDETQVKKAIQQIDPATGNVIGEFESINEAARTLGFNPGNISQAVKSGNTSYGFKWVLG